MSFFKLKPKDVKGDFEFGPSIHTSPIESCLVCQDEFYGISEAMFATHLIESLVEVQTLKRVVDGKAQMYNGKRWVNCYL